MNMGYKVYNDSRENYNTMVELIGELNMSAKDVLGYLTDWHGLELLDYGFMENLLTCELGLELDEEDADEIDEEEEE